MSVEWFSAIGQWVGALATVFGLPFIGQQILLARRTADFQVLQTFLHDVKSHEDALLKAASSGTGDQAFIEYLNFLEIYAASLIRKLLPKTSHKMVQDKIIDALSLIESHDFWKQKFLEAVTSHTTFEYLCQFMKLHRLELDSLIKAREALKT
jgi:hypothetical protein